MTSQWIEMRKAAKLLCEGKTDHEAAAAAGVSAEEIKWWRENNPNFQRDLELHRTNPTLAAAGDGLAEAVEQYARQAEQEASAELSTSEDDIPPAAEGGGSVTMQKSSAIELLVSGRSVTQVAKDVGVNRSTIARWKQEEAFSHEYEIRKQEALTELRARMPGMLNKAIDVLQTQLENGDPRVALELLRLAFRHGGSASATANPLAPPQVISLDAAKHGEDEGPRSGLSQGGPPRVDASKTSNQGKDD